MPVWIAPLFYTLLSLLIISKAKFFQTGINKRWVLTAFIYKVLLGLANYYIWLHVIGRGDSINYIHDADMIYATLFENPSHFFQLTFGYGPTNVYPEHLRYISDPLKYSWDDVEYTMVRINSILHVFTFGNAWGNIAILCFVFFSAAIALFKFLAAQFRNNTTWLFALIFFFPSIVIWSSGLLKEGYALAIFSLLIVQFFKMETRITRKNVLMLFLLLFAMFIIREYVVLLLLPNVFLWWLSRRNGKPARTFILFTMLAAIIVVAADAYSYKFTISEIVCEAQQYFILFEPDPEYSYHIFTGYELLEPLEKIPYTLNNILFRPNIVHSHSLFRIYMAIELMLTWLAILYLFIRKQDTLGATHWLLIAVSIELLFMYGMVVTDADTMSRYRVIPVFLLLLVGLLTSHSIKSLRFLQSK